jgi:hypothetical protein
MSESRQAVEVPSESKADDKMCGDPAVSMDVKGQLRCEKHTSEYEEKFNTQLCRLRVPQCAQ